QSSLRFSYTIHITPRAHLAPPGSATCSQPDEIALSENTHDLAAIEDDQTADFAGQHRFCCFSERCIRRRRDHVRLHGVCDRYRVQSGPLRASAVPQRPDQPVVEQVSLADDTGEPSRLVENREMADTAESHHVVGDGQLVVAIQRDDVAGHHVTHEAKMTHGLSSSSHSSWNIGSEIAQGPTYATVGVPDPNLPLLEDFSESRLP